MEALFFKLLDMSITASYITLVIVIFRFVFKRAPKWITCFLWMLVGFRLLLPFSVESVISLAPDADISKSIIKSIAPNISVDSLQSEVVHSSGKDVISLSQASVEISNSVENFGVIRVVSFIWMIGVVLMLLYMVNSYIKTYKRVKSSMQITDNVFVCDAINTPFIFGIFRPRIYLPSSMSKDEVEYVILHERAHILRYDHFSKFIGFILLSVYWFNPIIWLAYMLLCRDIEFACDQRVIKEFSTEQRKKYTSVLLNCSIPKKMITACPLAFGEVGVKNRIKTILNFKRPAAWIIVVSLTVSAIVIVCLLTNPISESKLSLGQDEITLSPIEILYHNHLNTMSDYTPEDIPHCRVDEDNNLYHFDKYGTEWEFYSEMQKTEISDDNFQSRFLLTQNDKIGTLDSDAILSIMHNNKTVYEAYRDNGEGFISFYMLLEQNDGTFYVVYGNRDLQAASVLEDPALRNGYICLVYSAEITDFQ